MIYAALDIDLPDDPDFVALEQENPAWPWWWMRLVQFAKRANVAGRLLKADGRPATSLHLAQTHHRDRSKQEAWQEFLDFACDLGLLVEENGCLRIRHWSRWHRSPSDEADSVRERVTRHRASKKQDVTSCNGCNDTEQRQSRDRAETEQKPAAAVKLAKTTLCDEAQSASLNGYAVSEASAEPTSVRAAAERVIQDISPGGIGKNVRTELYRLLEWDIPPAEILSALEAGLTSARQIVAREGSAKIRSPALLAISEARKILGLRSQTSSDPAYF